MNNLIYFYLLSPLHTGGTSQEGNVLGIARESHTDYPYIPSSSIRGRIRASCSDRITRTKLFGPDLKDLKDTHFLDQYQLATDRTLTQLEQGNLWIGDASLLWIPVPSLSHGVIWISCPMLLQRWARLTHCQAPIPPAYSANPALHQSNNPIYLKDAILGVDRLQPWSDTNAFVPISDPQIKLDRCLVLPDSHCKTLIQMSLWRQVKVKLTEHKSVEGGSFRYEEAIPPDTLMYFPWGTVTEARTGESYDRDFIHILESPDLDHILQIGGQEGLGRGFVQFWLSQSRSTVSA